MHGILCDELASYADADADGVQKLFVCLLAAADAAVAGAIVSVVVVVFVRLK